MARSAIPFLISILAAAPPLPTTHALILPNSVGKLPALGWNSWNAFRCDINEKVFLDAATKLVDLGLKDAGYVYVIVDDCWSNKNGRDPETNRLVPNATRFPDGMKALADQVHEKGLLFGIYSSAGNKTCGGYPASLGYEELDAETWAEWGVDCESFHIIPFHNYSHSFDYSITPCNLASHHLPPLFVAETIRNDQPPKKNTN